MPLTYADLIADLRFKPYFTTTNSDRQALINQLMSESECEILNEAWSQRCPDAFRTRAIFLLTAHRVAQLDKISSIPVSADGTINTGLAVVGQVASMTVAQGSNTLAFTLPDIDKVGTKWGDWVETVWGMQLIEIVSRYKLKYIGFVR